MENTNLMKLKSEHLERAIFKEIGKQIVQLKKEFEPENPKELLTRKETAKLFKVNISTIHNWCKKGYIAKYGIGNRVYFRRSEIEESITQIN